MIRMWQDAAGGRTDEWRGSVRDVSAGRTYYVVGTREIADFIASALADGDVSSDSSG